MELIATKNIFGQRISVIAGDLIGKKILKTGAYDKTGLFFIEILLRHLEKPVCLDIGANIGNHAIVMSRHAGTVHAFEPQPKVYSVLNRNISDNQITNIYTYNFGISNISGTAKMAVLDEGNTGATSFLNFDASVPSLVAELRHGDKELNASGVHHVDFIKIDVEGLEASVIDGLRGTLSTSMPILMMEWNSDETRNGFRDKQLFSTIFKDYKFYSLSSSHERPGHTESNLQKTKRKLLRRLFDPKIKLMDFSERGDYGNVVGVHSQKLEFLSNIFT